MERKKKKLPILAGIKIERYAAEGKCVAHFDSVGSNGGISRDKEGNQIRKVLFVPFAAEGDVCDVQILKSRSSYAEGKIVRLIEASPVRVQPVCNMFGVCGGCKWQHVPYEEQLKFKQQQVMDALQRIGKVELPTCHPIDGSRETLRYRNKLEFTFSNKKWISFEEMDELRAQGKEVPMEPGVGFHIPESFDKVLDIDHCYLQEEISDEVRLWVKQYAIENGLTFYDLRQRHGLLRNMVVRTALTGEKMLIVVFGEDEAKQIDQLMSALHERFPQFTSLMYVVNRQAYELYNHARPFAGLDEKQDALVYDLYTGTGTIANFVARNARKVVGIEYVEDAIEDAKINSAFNGIDNTLFFAGDMKDILTEDFVQEHGRPDIIITDPPRAGMHEDVINVILMAEPKVIVYVSCNPATQARDLQLLDAKYRVTDIQPVDMFPHTQHVENVVRLELK